MCSNKVQQALFSKCAATLENLRASDAGALLPALLPVVLPWLSFWDLGLLPLLDPLFPGSRVYQLGDWSIKHQQLFKAALNNSSILPFVLSI